MITFKNNMKILMYKIQIKIIILIKQTNCINYNYNKTIYKIIKIKTK